MVGDTVTMYVMYDEVPPPALGGPGSQLPKIKMKSISCLFEFERKNLYEQKQVASK